MGAGNDITVASGANGTMIIDLLLQQSNYKIPSPKLYEMLILRPVAGSGEIEAVISGHTFPSLEIYHNGNTFYRRREGSPYDLFNEFGDYVDYARG